MPDGSVSLEIGEIAPTDASPQETQTDSQEPVENVAPDITAENQPEPETNDETQEQTPAEAPPTATPESSPTPEKKLTRQEEEINSLAEILLNKSYQQNTEPTTEEGKKFAEVLKWVHFYKLSEPGNYISDKFPNGYSTKENNLTITRNNEEYKILFITSGDEKNFECIATNGEGERTITVKREDLYKKQLGNEKDTILQGFPEDQRVIIDLYIQGQIEDMSVLESYPPEKINQLITEVATNAGIMTTDDLRAFIDSKYPEPDPNKKLTVDDLKIVDRRREAFRIIDNKVIVDPKLASDFFISIGGTDELGKGVAKLELEIQALEDMKVKADRRGEAVSKEIAEELDNKKREKKAYESITSGDAMEAYFSQVLDGTLDQEESKELIRAFRTGDSKNIIDTTFKNTLSKLPPEVYEKHKREIEAFQKNLFNKSGAGIFALLWIAFELSMTLKDAVK